MVRYERSSGRMNGGYRTADEIAVTEDEIRAALKRGDATLSELVSRISKQRQGRDAIAPGTLPLRLRAMKGSGAVSDRYDRGDRKTIYKLTE